MLAAVFLASSGSKAADAGRLENLAVSRPVRASSTAYAPTLPEFAVDGEPDSRWVAEAADPQWLEVDLGAECEISKVRILSCPEPIVSGSAAAAKRPPGYGNWLAPSDFHVSHAADYEIEISTDGSRWTTVARNNAGKGGSEELGFPTVSGRFVRLYVIKRSNPNPLAVNELEVYGRCGAARPPQVGWKVRRKPRSASRIPPVLREDGEFEFAGGWEMAGDSPALPGGAELSKTDYDSRAWYDAAVPGTVLANLTEESVFPEPLYGMNNLDIPEALNRRAWWYRYTFTLPSRFRNSNVKQFLERPLQWFGYKPEPAQKRIWLEFDGINPAAEIWLNGTSVGTLRGAFQRGSFDVTALIKQNDDNVLAVRIDPPGNPGLPLEQSVEQGAGLNGGLLTKDGPTFFATIGWDWIPGIRDRDIGIWNHVHLRDTGPVTLADPQVVSHLPEPDLSRAELTVRAEVRNATAEEQHGTLNGEIEGVTFTQPVTLLPGEAKTVEFAPGKFPQLVFRHPRLWWPNGYGKQNLYDLHLTFDTENELSDTASVRFGIRKMEYLIGPKDGPAEITFPPVTARYVRMDGIHRASEQGFSLFDFEVFSPETGGTDLALNKVAVASTSVDGSLPGNAVDGNSATRWMSAYREPEWIAVDLGAPVPVNKVRINWTASYARDYKVQVSNDGTTWTDAAAVHNRQLQIVVNGQKIFCGGGNWGMDEAMKRMPRARMEALLRMHKDANVTMIRNWTGMATSEDFYDLCDEDGILVWNDFWLANPGDGPNPADENLFLDNARDTIKHYRNHPSIAIWCGRNEGVPPPDIDSGLRKLAQDLDGTRYYQPDSASQGVSGRGPYHYVPPKIYFTDLAEGFKTEIGLPCVPSAESIRGMLPPDQRWPINDAWAYHDFCEKGAAAAGTYLTAIDSSFGAPTGLEDFCRKAQMINYDSYRAIFEAWNHKLWQDCSGVLLWMSNPAWPSTVWQLYAYDLEPTAALFGVQKGMEPIHIQMNLPDGMVTVINHGSQPLAGLQATATIYNLDGSEAASTSAPASVAANNFSDCFPIAWPAVLSPAHFVKLRLADAHGKVLSENFYWHASRDQDLAALSSMPKATASATFDYTEKSGKVTVTSTVRNARKNVALMVKLTLRRSEDRQRILPAFYSDNYFSLLPGESKAVTVECAGADLHGETPELALDGWNVEPAIAK